MPSPVIVEDGTIIADANSYLSVAEADAYHDARNNSDWTAAPARAREAAVIVGSDYITREFERRWKGIRVNINQTLAWPRAGVLTEEYFEPQTEPRPALFPDLSYLIPDNIVPEEVKDATAEAALRGLNGTLLPDLARGGEIKSLKAGPASVEYFAAAKTTTTYQTIDQLLKRLLRNFAGQRTLVRT